MLRLFINKTILIIIISAGSNLICSHIKKPVDDSGILNAKQIYAFDYETQFAYYAKNEHTKMTPSSMTKIITAYIVFDDLQKNNISMEQKFLSSTKASNIGGSSMFLTAGQRVKIIDLLKGILTVSGNDAAITIAENISGSEENFAARMNQMAKELEMKNSNFKNASGMPEPSHYTSAYDMGIISKKIIEEFADFYYLFSNKSFTFNKVFQKNYNTLLFYPDLFVDGIKTGQTKDGGFGGVFSSLLKDGRRIIIVINGLSDIKQRESEVEYLINHIKNNFENKLLFKKGQKISKQKVFFGNKNHINLVSNKDIKITKRKSDNIAITIKYKSPITPVIEKGKKVATMTIKTGGINHKIPLYSDINVKSGSWPKRFIDWIEYLIFGDKN